MSQKFPFIYRSQNLVFFSILSVLLMMWANHSIATEDDQQQAESIEIMQAFSELDEGESDIVKISEKQKHTILFFMGIALLILLVATAVFGVAMGVHGKPVFIQHMVCAALTVTLAIAHAIVSIVWFFPFK